MPAIDFKKTIPSYAAKKNTFAVVEVPPLRYLMIDGSGDPNTSQAFTEAISTIYPVAYRLKFTSKKTLGQDYSVMPLEALWWSDDPANFTTALDKSKWSWTVMNLVPDWITAELFETVVAEVAQKKDAPALLDLIRLESLDEGLSVQALHVGPFDAEAPLLARMHQEYLPAQGLRPRGRHHEIYFSDFRKADPAKLRTIVRQPVEAF